MSERIVMRTGECLVAGGPPFTAAEPEVVIGELGHPDRKQLTAIGDPVNIAARIETATKTVGVPLLVSSPFAEQVAGLDWPSHEMPLKGKRETARLFAPPV